MYSSKEIYDMIVRCALRDEIPATDQEIELAIELVENGLGDYSHMLENLLVLH